MKFSLGLWLCSLALVHMGESRKPPLVMRPVSSHVPNLAPHREFTGYRSSSFKGSFAQVPGPAKAELPSVHADMALQIALLSLLVLYICFHIVLSRKRYGALGKVQLRSQPIEDPSHVPCFKTSQTRLQLRKLPEVAGSAPAAEVCVRVLTLNALCTPVPNNRVEVVRLRALAQHIKSAEYDIVCLQEFMQHTCPLGLSDQDHVAAYDSFCTTLKHMGFSEKLGPAKGGTLYDGGTVIFSKLPFKSTELIPWVEQASWDSLAAKGLVCAKVEVQPPEGISQQPVPLHIFTLHAQATHRGWKNWKGNAAYTQVRLRQMHQVADVVARRATDAGEAALVLGDFNFDSRHAKDFAAHQAALKHKSSPNGPIDVVWETHGEHPATHGVVDKNGQVLEKFLTSHENQGVPECLDHVYWWPGSLAVDGTQPCSDGSIVAAECAMQTMEIHNFPHSSRKAGLCTHISDHFGWSVDLFVSWPGCQPPTESSQSQDAGYGSHGKVQTSAAPPNDEQGQMKPIRSFDKQ